ncbi:hypothetical protein A2673_01490 [Candidatus Kaiserbacteria bacterium RIFCSPHIGHO2_01_FULL_50_13]|uniref:Uncharacterized protein n=1 Tax=Candidatus Kaiserbacteria bacterium RIFCSPLOWO2_01_FULL_50_24 TaxID=1798507 RepID=A0A1F6EMD2_9BACT|nr:MAG: hypothetical protein A2673_01490 [Candidatus Kaiserbacteria bacterium RIFCSPHIGHO2_01_FULL_50_13]OGG74796.1 MAG: hypothetical protein A3A34_00190 [Candidatus Kaiserbacteria bacterium RIFCSPLOWO2_01_FULL_50_24]OGG81379.1 MAG: hypothetical protein A3H74_02975 [Candidatus Kaiserbacteria bacterium RIFCSPLOWO2_02_FULL_51_13]
MVPILGLPALSLVQAMGIALVVRFIIYQHHDSKDEDENAIWKALAFVVLYPALALFIGWVVHLFM